MTGPARPAGTRRTAPARRQAETTGTHAGEGRAHVRFDLRGLKVALPARQVVEVGFAVEICPLPKAPRIVEGTINYRGHLTPVLDMRRRFGQRTAVLSPQEHLIVARRADGRLIAFRVDRIDEIVRIPDDCIEDARSSVPEALYVAGVAKLPDGLILIHDIDSFLDSNEDSRLTAALKAAVKARASVPAQEPAP